MTFTELLLECLDRFFDPCEGYSGRLGKFLWVERELRFLVEVRLPSCTLILIVDAMSGQPILSLLDVELLLLVAPGAFNCLGMLFRPFKVGKGQGVPLSILPSNVDEFFLVCQHVLFVELVDLHKFTVLKPSVHTTANRSRFVSLEQGAHDNANCFRTIFTRYNIHKLRGDF